MGFITAVVSQLMRRVVRFMSGEQSTVHVVKVADNKRRVRIQGREALLAKFSVHEHQRCNIAGVQGSRCGDEIGPLVVPLGQPVAEGGVQRRE